MKKIILCLLVLLTLSIGINVYADNQNLLKNAGFETVTDSAAADWSTYIWNQKDGQYSIAPVSSEKHSGNSSLQIVSKNTNDIRVKQDLAVKPNTFYKLTAWVKTQNVGEGTKGANISADGILFTSKDVHGNSDWQQIELYGETGKGQKSVTVTFGLGGYGSENSGTMWLDDVAVEPLKVLPSGVKAVSLLKPKTESSDTAQQKTYVSAIISLLALIAGIAIAFYIGNKIIKTKPLHKTEMNNDFYTCKTLKIDKRDIKAMTAITVFYTVIALLNLGSLNIPQTGYSPANYTDSVTVDFEKSIDLDRLYYFGGLGDGTFTVDAADDSGSFTQIAKIEKKDIFSFKYTAISAKTSKVRITPSTTGYTLNEIYFTEKGKTVPVQIKNVISEDTNSSKLFDEQKTFAYKPSYMTNMYFDEIYHARTAFEHIHKIEPYEWTHPPLGKVLMAIGVLIFGMAPFGYRIVGTLFGVAMLPLLYLFGKKIFRDWRFAAITSILMMFDFMHFTQTRIATIDVYGTFFIIAMYYYMYDTFMIKSYNIPYRLSVKPLLLCGLMFGLGVASKWIAAYGGAGLALIFFTSKYLEYRDYKKLTLDTKHDKPEWLESFISKRIILTMLLCVIFFIIIPCTIYYLSYVPYMEVPGAKKGLDLVLSYQKQMFDYHSKLKATHAFSSPWYEWPIIYKPTWFYSGSDVANGYASTIVTMGNPAIWWTGIPAFFTAVYVAYKKKDKKMALIFAAIVFQYMPWVLVPRITWIYHYFSTVPFIIICIVYVMKELYERNTISRKTIFIYLTICAVLFLWFYPALSGLEVPQNYIYSLRWFYSWIF